VKNLPWSPETTKWAQTDSADPSTSPEAIQERMKTIRDILNRPSPVSSAPASEPELSNPVYEKDTTDKEMPEDISLGEIQADLRRWWKGDEEQRFYEKLAIFKAKLGDDLADSDVFEYWIAEWTRKMREKV